jgi:hypothetical protein
MSMKSMPVITLVRSRGLFGLSQTKVAKMANDLLRQNNKIGFYNQKDVSRMEHNRNIWAYSELMEAATAIYRSMGIDADGTGAMIYVAPTEPTPGTNMAVVTLLRSRGLLGLTQPDVASRVNDLLKKAGSILEFKPKDIGKIENPSNNYIDRKLRMALTDLYRSLGVDADEPGAMLYVPPTSPPQGIDTSAAPAT